MNSPQGLVAGTAGHIDHGKTTLVRALTGIDTDRLAEEKRRGISIDLGFAHLTLSDGRRISFIDVPGHERFIKNMLAGVGGIQAVLLIVAADESVKPQTREHFEICRLLEIQQGIVVLTKIDLATPEQIFVTREDVRALCAGSFLEGAPVVPVSAATGQGLAELKADLAKLADRTTARDDAGLMRLPIDRSFALKGFGTVVTGTMWNGRLRVGDTVRVHPGKRAARVRGLEVHGKRVEVALAGQRSAVNLTGVDSSELRRGFVLTHPDNLDPTKLLDVTVDWLTDSAIPARRAQFLFHIGTAEVPAVLKVLGRRDGSVAFARLWLDEPVLALPGDRFVLRRPSPAETVAGGSVVDAFPAARLNRVKAIARLKSLVEADSAKRLEILIEESVNGRGLPELVRLTGLPPDTIRSLIGQNPKLLFAEAAQRAVSTIWLEQMRQKLCTWLRDFHIAHPAAAGAPVASARLKIEPNLATVIFDGFPGIRVQGDVVSLASHRAQVSDAEAQMLLQIERAFREAGLQPPPASDVLRSTGTDPKKGRGLLETLIKAQKLMRISDDLIFHADVLSHVRKSLASYKGRRFSVAEFKDWTQVSRKFAIPLLEYLDRQRVTRREGDARVVL